MPTHYFDDDPKVTSYEVTGRIAIDELISLLQHVQSHSQQIWLEEITYRYSEGTNKGSIRVSAIRDRPHGNG